jgi:hypothetical protein
MRFVKRASGESGRVPDGLLEFSPSQVVAKARLQKIRLGLVGCGCGFFLP